MFVYSLEDCDYTQKKPTEIWENNASCIGMSENPANHDQDISIKTFRCQGRQSP
jgi:hypothetical protein